MADVQFEVGFNERQINQQLNRIEKEVQGFRKTTESQVGRASQVFNVFAGATLSRTVVAGFQAAQRAAGALFDTLVVDGVRAAQVQEDAVQDLNIALKSVGIFSQDASRDLQEFASQLQQNSRIGDEAILTNIGLLQSLARLDSQGLKQATQAALDLSAALKLDLETSFRLVGRAASGEISLFSRYGLQIQRGTTDTETFANVLDTINEKFGGAAQQQIETYAGATQQLSNTFGDLTEEIGFVITTNDVFVDAIKQINSFLGNLGQQVKENRNELQLLAGNVGLGAVISGINLLTDGVLLSIKVFTGLSIASSGIKQLFLGIANAAVNVALSLREAQISAAEFFNIDTGPLEEQKQKLEELSQSLTSQREENLRSVNEFVLSQERIIKGLDNTRDKAVEFLEETKAANQTAIQERIAQEQQLTTALTEEQQKRLEAERVASEQRIIAKNEENERLRQIEAAEREIALLDKDEQIAREQLERDERLQAIADSLGSEEAIRVQAEVNRLEREKKFGEARKKIRDAERKAEEQSVFQIQKFSELSSKQRLANLQGTLGTISSLSSSSNKTLFNISKGSAIATSVIDGILATQKALASAPPPANFVLAGLVGAATAANTAAIASQQPPSFQQGGFVPGTATTGDVTTIRANAGEAILNPNQQRNFMNLANNGSDNSAQVSLLEVIAQGINNLNQAIREIGGDVVVEIDQREIARAVRLESQAGFAA